MSATAALSKLLTRTRAASDQRQAGHAARYAELVRAAGRGDDRIDPEALVEFLTAAGYDIDQFQADAERHAQRLALKAEIEAVPGLRKKLEGVRSKLAAAEAERAAAVAAAEAKFDLVAGPLAEQARQLDADIVRGERAAGELVRTADPERLAELDAARRELHAARLHRDRFMTSPDGIRKQIEECRALIADPFAMLGHGHIGSGSPSQRQAAIEQRKREAELRLARYEADLPRYVSVVAEAEQAVAALEAKLAKAEAAVVAV